MQLVEGPALATAVAKEQAATAALARADSLAAQAEAKAAEMETAAAAALARAYALAAKAEAKVAEMERAASAAPYGDLSKGVIAPIQLAKMPCRTNWAHLSPAPTEFWLEVGANGFDYLREEMEKKGAFGRGAFLLSFEPLLDKYARPRFSKRINREQKRPPRFSA